MSNVPYNTGQQGVVAVLHSSANRWRGLVGQLGGSKPVIIASREFEAGESGQIESWFDEYRVEQVITVLPASSVICRTCPLPNAQPEQLIDALQLQAEAHLLEVAPPNRLAMAVLPSAPQETSRHGLILAWPESAPAEHPPTDRNGLYTPDIAALAALLDGTRPVNPLLWLDRATGSVAVSITHADGAVFRATREEAGSLERWQQGVGRVVAETALSVGHTGPFVESLVRMAQQEVGSIPGDESALLLPREIIESACDRLDGASSDPQWWSEYGIAAGVILARAGSLAPLTELQDAPPEVHPSLYERVGAALSAPRTAVRIVLACLLVLALSPLIISFLNVQALQARHGDLEARLDTVNTLAEMREIYDQVEKNAWPMTKLLADVVSATPEGITLDLIHIPRGGEVRVSGVATTKDLGPQALIARMQEQLQMSGIFGEVRLNWKKGDNFGNYQFGLSAAVAKPHLAFDYPEEMDFGTRTLADRLYGPRTPAPDADDSNAPAGAAPGDAVVVGAPVTAPPAEPKTNGSATVGGRPALSGSGMEPSGIGSPRRTGLPPGTTGNGGIAASDFSRSRGGEDVISQAEKIPPPMTAEQINALSRAEGLAKMTEYAKARQYARTRGDAELDKRLREEWELIKARIDALKRGEQR